MKLWEGRKRFKRIAVLLLLSAYLDTNDCRCLKLSVFFHVRDDLQSKVAGNPFRLINWHEFDFLRDNIRTIQNSGIYG